MLSKQTPAERFFSYNPLAGADVLLFPRDRDPKNPRRFILQTSPHDSATATACGGIVVITINDARQLECHVNGKRTERFSIVYPNKRRKRIFASY